MVVMGRKERRDAGSKFLVASGAEIAERFVGCRDETNTFMSHSL